MNNPVPADDINGPILRPVETVDGPDAKFDTLGPGPAATGCVAQFLICLRPELARRGTSHFIIQIYDLSVAISLRRQTPQCTHLLTLAALPPGFRHAYPMSYLILASALFGDGSFDSFLFGSQLEHATTEGVSRVARSLCENMSEGLLSPCPPWDGEEAMAAFTEQFQFYVNRFVSRDGQETLLVDLSEGRERV